MRIKLSIIWLLLVSAFSARAVKHNADSTLIENYTVADSSWAISGKNVYFWNGLCSQNLYLVGYSHNTGTMAWDSSEFNANSYDINGDLATSTYKYGTGTLTPYVNYIYARSGGLLSSYTAQYWYDYLSAYRDSYRNVYHYDSQSRQDTVWTETWDTAANIWQPSARYLYVYDASGNDTLYEHQIYNAGTSTYTNDYRYQYTYTAFNKQSTSLRSVWNGTSLVWVSTVRTTSSFDVSENLTGYISETGSNGGTTWTNNNRAAYTNNSDGQPSQIVYSDWGPSLNAWIPAQRYTYFYGCIAPSAITNVKTDNIELYPNPAHNSVILTLADLNTSTYLSIYNMMGEKMSEQAIAQGTNHINIAALASGVYLLKWQEDSRIITRKIIKE